MEWKESLYMVCKIVFQVQNLTSWKAHYILIEDLHFYNWHFSTDEMCHTHEKLKSVMQTHDVWTHGQSKMYKADSWNHGLILNL